MQTTEIAVTDTAQNTSVQFKIGVRFSDGSRLVVNASTENIPLAKKMWLQTIEAQNEWLTDPVLRAGLRKLSAIRQRRTSEMIVMIGNHEVSTGSYYPLTKDALFTPAFVEKAFDKTAEAALKVVGLPPIERTDVVVIREATDAVKRITAEAYNKKVLKAANKKLEDIQKQWIEFDADKFSADVERQIKKLVK